MLALNAPRLRCSNVSLEAVVAAFSAVHELVPWAVTTGIGSVCPCGVTISRARVPIALRDRRSDVNRVSKSEGTR